MVLSHWPSSETAFWLIHHVPSVNKLGWYCVGWQPTRIRACACKPQMQAGACASCLQSLGSLKDASRRVSLALTITSSMQPRLWKSLLLLMSFQVLRRSLVYRSVFETSSRDFDLMPIWCLSVEPSLFGAKLCLDGLRNPCRQALQPCTCLCKRCSLQVVLMLGPSRSGQMKRNFNTHTMAKFRP